MNEHEQQPPSETEPTAETGETATTLSPQIYVASLSDYNDGRLHGAWLDATDEPDQLGEGLARMLAASPMAGAEEWAIHDFDDFAGVRIGENESLETVSAIANGLRQHGPAFGAWVDIVGREPESMALFSEAYSGKYDSLTAYADELLDELGYRSEVKRLLPAWLLDYVHLDVGMFGHDLETSGQIYTAPTPDGGIWIFDSNYV